MAFRLSCSLGICWFSSRFESRRCEHGPKLRCDGKDAIGRVCYMFSRPDLPGHGQAKIVGFPHRQRSGDPLANLIPEKGYSTCEHSRTVLVGLVSSGSSHFTRFEREPPGSGTANTMEEDATKAPLKPVGRFARLHGECYSISATAVRGCDWGQNKAKLPVEA